MWKWIGDAAYSFFGYSSLPLTLGIIIAALSIGDIFVKKKKIERALKISVAGFSILLLIAQAVSGKAASKEAEVKLNAALQRQRNDLTQAFNAGTDQVIKATNETATQTQRSAKDQTDAIERQAQRQFAQLQGATLGSTTCPDVVASIIRPNGRPRELVAFNLDKKLNMYDVNMELTEWGPAGPGEPWSTILQRRQLHFPILVPQRAQSVPFQFLSKMTDIDVQILLTTRATSCSGRIDAFDTGNNVWVNDHTEMFQLDGKSGKLVYQQNSHLSPGLAKSKPDPQSQ